MISRAERGSAPPPLPFPHRCPLAADAHFAAANLTPSSTFPTAAGYDPPKTLRKAFANAASKIGAPW